MRSPALAMGWEFRRRHLWALIAMAGYLRSEEHTSELQSRSDLVCRLLLEKKKKIAPLSRRGALSLARAVPPHCTTTSRNAAYRMAFQFVTSRSRATCVHLRRAALWCG